MSEMVERVARAIAEDQDGMEDYWDAYVNAARAAIAAMREPTDKMIEASLDDAWTAHTRQLYQRMIDAALK